MVGRIPKMMTAYKVAKVARRGGLLTSPLGLAALGIAAVTLGRRWLKSTPGAGPVRASKLGVALDRGARTFMETLRSEPPRAAPDPDAVRSAPDPDGVRSTPIP
jgi:hypothetical protein